MAQPNDARAENISIEEVQRFLNRFLPQTCDFCGANRWTVFNDGNGHPSVGELCLQVTGPNGEKTIAVGGAVPVLQVQCLNCGQMKYFSLLTILEKVKEDRQ